MRCLIMFSFDFEKCVEGDESLMLVPVIMKAVAKQLSDESISVREAAVALIGNYLSRSPPMAIQNYHEFLVPCLTDPGVSVRKRAVKIFQSILIKNPYYRGRTAVFKILLQRSTDPKEEDSIRDLIDELLHMLWFRAGSEPVSRPQRFEDERKVPMVSIPGVVTPNSPMASTKRKSVQLRSDIAAEQMMEVVQAEGSGIHLESVLMSLLKGFSGSLENSGRKQPESRKRLKGGESQCSQIVNSLFELLLVLDEQRDIRQHVGRDISATFTTIAVFANICPHALLKHFDLILPYLKADNGVSMNDESAIICSVCDILHRLAPVLDPSIVPRQSGLAIAKDLTKISYKFGPAALTSAIRAFSILANHLDGSEHTIFADKLLEVAKTFYGYALKKNEIDDFASINVRKMISPSLKLPRFQDQAHCPVCFCHEG
jgi:HEAT repeat associated with sister chromatid cohesion